MKIIETERLYLREMTPDDAAHFYLLNEDEAVIKYTGDAPFKDIEDAKLFLENYDQYKKHKVGRWAVIDKATSQFLGWCGLKYTPERNEYDIGFRFFKKYWNKGYATEAASACLTLGFESFHINEIVGRAMAENIASVKVLEKIGLSFVENFDFERNAGVLYKIKST